MPLEKEKKRNEKAKLEIRFVFDHKCMPVD